MIKLCNLTIGYGSHRLIFGASCVLPDAGLVALIGRNGAGKSSLLRVLAGISQAQSGSVEVNGRNVASMSVGDRSRSIALVTTERLRVPDLRCSDVVGMGRAPYTDWIGRLSAADTDIVNRSLAAVGMAGYASRTMDTMSDGECQRVMIARAIAQDAHVILLDEPTSFLDMPNRYEICSLLRDLSHNQRKTIIFSTHELDIALDLSDSMLLIDGEGLICGTPDEILAQGCIQRLFRNSTVRFDSATRRMLSV